MTEDRHTAMIRHGHPSHEQVLDQVLQVARSDRYEGYSKHDGDRKSVV